MANELRWKDSVKHNLKRATTNSRRGEEHYRRPRNVERNRKEGEMDQVNSTHKGEEEYFSIVCY